MNKPALTLALLVTATFANEPVTAQTFQNGPYYANPSWDQQIPAAQRFIVLSNWSNAAVLDRETGLVWERAPVFINQKWAAAASICHSFVSTGHRLGWRLPSIEELTSLSDPLSNTGLPAGHPFQGINNVDPYWSATTVESVLDEVYVVVFADGGFPEGRSKRGADIGRVWCVRGGSSTTNPTVS